MTKVTGRVSRAGLVSYPAELPGDLDLGQPGLAATQRGLAVGGERAGVVADVAQLEGADREFAEVREDRPGALAELGRLRVDGGEELGAAVVLDRVGHLLQHRSADAGPPYTLGGLVRGRRRSAGTAPWSEHPDQRARRRSGADRRTRLRRPGRRPGRARPSARSGANVGGIPRARQRPAAAGLRALRRGAAANHRQGHRVALFVDHLGPSLLTCPSQAGHYVPPLTVRALGRW